MKNHQLGTILLVVGLVVVIYGAAPVLGLSGLPTSCPSSVSMTLQNGTVVTGSLLSPSEAAIAWNVQNPTGLLATYLLSVSYGTITADGGYASGSNVGYFQPLTGGNTYGYLNGLTYQSDGSCSSGPAPSSTTVATTTSVVGANTLVCQGSDCSVTISITCTSGCYSATTTSSSSGVPVCTAPKGTACTAAQPANIDLPIVLAGLIILGLGLFVTTKKKGNVLG